MDFKTRLYLKAAEQATNLETGGYWQAVLFSSSHVVPFYSGSRTAKADVISSLFGTTEQIPDWVHGFTLAQGFISGVLVFLIALALRNIFRS